MAAQPVVPGHDRHLGVLQSFDAAPGSPGSAKVLGLAALDSLHGSGLHGCLAHYDCPGTVVSVVAGCLHSARFGSPVSGGRCGAVAVGDSVRLLGLEPASAPVLDRIENPDRVLLF